MLQPQADAHGRAVGMAPIWRASSSMSSTTLWWARGPPLKRENSAVSNTSQPPVGAMPDGISGPPIVPLMRSRATPPVPSNESQGSSIRSMQALGSAGNVVSR